MAESPTATETAPSTSGPDAGLDAAIADLGAQIAQAQAQAPVTNGAAPDSQAPAPTEQPTSTDVPEPGGDEDTEEGSENPQQPGQPAKPSRSHRLAQQLTTAENESRTLKERLGQVDLQQRLALQQFVDLVLPDATLEALRVQAEGGDWEAKQRVDQARMWRRMVAPIADLAHRSARQQFDSELAALRTLDGMDGDSHQKLLSADSPGEKLRLMHQVAFKAADAIHKETIASLQAEIQALKTNRAANGTQPANGGRPGSGATGLAGLIGPDGLLTDEAMRLSSREIEARFGRAS